MKLLSEHILPWKITLQVFLILALACGLPSLASSQSHYRNEPFDPAAKVLPHPYYGYDPVVYLKVARDEAAREQKARTKDEFETTAQYQERLKKMDLSNPLATSTYAFGVKPTGVSYDADKQTFTLRFRPEEAEGNVNYMRAMLQTIVKDTGRHTAENAFGAAFTVQESSVTIYKLWLVRAQGLPGCTATVNVPPAEAKLMNADIRALAVVKPVVPFESMDQEYSKPTFSSPRQIETVTGGIFGRLVGVRFYDWSTGRILGSCP
jgi:hypothetical protein